MERQFPKNVRQVGNVSDTPKIYVEDYVDTYLSQLREQAGEQPVGAFLVGDTAMIEDQECVCITGALQMREPDADHDTADRDGDTVRSKAANEDEDGSEEFEVDSKILEAGRSDAGAYFPGKELLGWFLILPGRPLVLSSKMSKLHEKMFPAKNSIFILMDAVSREELYFANKYQELMQMGGHYIFYEKNPDMQNYMIQKRRQIGVTPSELVEDRAAKDFRSTVREKMTAKEQRTNARFVYAMSVFLVLVVLAIGISAMNNYDKMTAVQTSIEALSESVQSTAAPSPEESQAQGTDSGELAAADGAGTLDPEALDPETVDPEVQAASNQMSDGASEIDWSQEDYYTVQKGDTLDRISQKLYGTTSQADAICRMNGLTDGNLIFIGQKLLLP